MPDPGYTEHQVNIPITAWSLAPVVMWIQQQFGHAPPEARVPGATSWFQIDAPLMPHQRDAVQYLVSRGSAVLGDEMGLGKTRTAIAAAGVLRDISWSGRPTLIIGPKFVRRAWESELVKAGYSGERFAALEGTNADVAVLDGARWIFCHYDIVHAWWSHIVYCLPVVAILDEGHLIKNSRTRRGKSVALALSLAPYRFVLTGTPIENRVGEFWNLLQMATGAWTWGSPRDFRERYAGATVNEHGGLEDGAPTHVEELKQRLASCYIRRTKRDAGIHLPALRRQLVEVEASEVDKARYDALLGQLDSAAMLRMLSTGRASTQALAWIGKLRKLASKIKLPTTVADVQSALEQGEHVLVFTWQRQTAEALAVKAAGGREFAVVHGGLAQRARDAAVERFQAGDVPLLVATLDSLGVGVTLTRATVLYMHDIDWVPSRMLQAEARFHRIGLDHPVISRWMVARGTLDARLASAIARKAEVIGEIVGDDEPVALGEMLSTLVEQAGGVDALVAWAKGA